MSRTVRDFDHHSLGHRQELHPNRDGAQHRGTGYEYWTSRGGKPHGEEPGRITKRMTHKRERRLGKREIQENKE